MTKELRALPDAGFERVLCVVAHPDDMEYGSSAAVAEWTRQGVAVGYLLITGGEAGMQRAPAEAGPLRAEEQKAACAAVGVSSLTILNHPDGVVTPSLELRRDIAREIRRFRPDAVVTGSWDVEFAGGLNQADHRAVGLACVDAVRDADNRWVFPELIADEGLEPWGASWLLVTGHNHPTHAVAVSKSSARKAVASLAAHTGYLADLPKHPEPEPLVERILTEAGVRLGVPRAVLFRSYNLKPWG